MQQIRALQYKVVATYESYKSPRELVHVAMHSGKCLA